MAKGYNLPRRRTSRGIKVEGKYLINHGREVNLETMFHLRDIAEQTMRLYNLQPHKQESKVILNCRLKEAVLNANKNRNPAEQECLELSRAVADIVFITSHFNPERVPLKEAERLYASALKALKIAKTGTEKMERDLETNLNEIGRTIKQKGRGSIKLPAGEHRETALFNNIGILASAKLKALSESDEISGFSKACFALINEVTKKIVNGGALGNT